MPRTSALTVAARLKAAGLALADEAYPPGATAVLAEDGAHHGRPGWVLVTVATGPRLSATP